jgi:hypothetical protein
MLAPALARADVPGRRRQAELPTLAMLDAQSLGPGHLAFGLTFGFPYVQALVGYGLVDGIDLDLQVDTLYGAATQVGIGPKVRLLGDDGLALAAQVHGQATVFRHPVIDETSTGARHVTGLRNFGVEPGLVVSSRGLLGSTFGAVTVPLTYASEAEFRGPLSGALPAWGTNLGVYVGGELKAGAGLVHLFAEAGVDFHFRDGDSPVLPRVELGFTFPG